MSELLEERQAAAEWKLTLEVNPQVVGVEDLELADYDERQRDTDEF